MFLDKAKKKGAKLLRSQSGVVPVTSDIDEARVVINRLPPPAPTKKRDEVMIVPE